MTKKYAGISCLYVEDDHSAREEMEMILSGLFDDFHLAENGQKGLKLFMDNNPDLIISDIRMPVMDGLQMIGEIGKSGHTPKFIITTAHSDIQYLVKAIELGVHNYVFKPINLDKLYEAIDRSVEIIRVQKMLEAEQKKKDQLIVDLRKALDEVHTLRGFLPICSYCHNIRDDEGYYVQLEEYLHKNQGLDFSHTICPTCLRKKYPKIASAIETTQDGSLK